MTLQEAIKWADNHQTNEHLNYYVLEYNNEYCVVSTSYIQRNDVKKWVYTTEGSKRTLQNKIY